MFKSLDVYLLILVLLVFSACSSDHEGTYKLNKSLIPLQNAIKLDTNNYDQYIFIDGDSVFVKTINKGTPTYTSWSYFLNSNTINSVNKDSSILNLEIQNGIISRIYVDNIYFEYVKISEKDDYKIKFQYRNWVRKQFIRDSITNLLNTSFTVTFIDKLVYDYSQYHAWKFTNKTSKDIDAFTFSFILNDEFDNLLETAVGIIYNDKVIKKDSSCLVKYHRDFNPFNNKHKFINETSPDNLVYTLGIDEIIFTDGTVLGGM